MIVPACETYQRERPRGGPIDQLSDLFGLSIYRWDEGDYGRYRRFMLDCKRSLPSLRPDLTEPQWEAATEKTIADLKQHTGYLNRLGEPMVGHRGPRPRRGEPDPTLAFAALSCDRFTGAAVNAWARGGAPGYGPEAPFSVHLAEWRYEVWRAFESRVLACGRQSGSPTEADGDWMRAVVVGVEKRASGEIQAAQREARARTTKVAGILARLAEAEGLTEADELATALQTIETLAAAGPRLGQTDVERIARTRERITARLRAARTADAESWERERPAREARARGQEEELAALQQRNREREADADSAREREARIEAERQAAARAQAERDAEAQRQRDVARRVADREAAAKADRETLDRFRREDAARLASDPCNKIEMRRQLMNAANALDRARFGGRRLLDLTDGRTVEEGPARSCMFVADWSSGPPGLVTITLRKNSFGDDLIEVRPF